MLTRTRTIPINRARLSQFNPDNIPVRVADLISQYLSIPQLNTLLEDLPHQLIDPQVRPWHVIDWQEIAPHQIIGIQPDIFLSILMGALETEAPIRGYTQTSRQYLAPIHPGMARYVGGTVTSDGTMLEPGLWEKEERQHTPALVKLYRHLTGREPQIRPRTVRGYSPSGKPQVDLYRHGLHRIATEYSAVCLYLWMMTHTTGALQQVLGELLQDEINHMTKFWGFGLWLYPETHGTRTLHILRHGLPAPTKSKTHPPAHQLLHTIRRMMGVLNWQAWPVRHRFELATTFIQVLYRLHQWSDRLDPVFLNGLLGHSPILRQADSAVMRR